MRQPCRKDCDIKDWTMRCEPRDPAGRRLIICKGKAARAMVAWRGSTLNADSSPTRACWLHSRHRGPRTIPELALWRLFTTSRTALKGMLAAPAN